MFELVTDYQPCGDQPQAIDQIVKGLEEGERAQVLLGITGSGKTFTMANIIQRVQRPALILAHNKTLAAQLYEEFRSFFPRNAVEYFVSYYDYYQPEAYIARTDTYIEKSMAINDRIDKLRLAATRSLLERHDVIIIASVSCIYGLGMPEYYAQLRTRLGVGDTWDFEILQSRLVEMHYTRQDFDLSRGSFRVRGDVVEIFPAYEDEKALRIEFFDDVIERIVDVDPLTGRVLQEYQEITLYPGSHHVTPEEIREVAISDIKEELRNRVKEYAESNRYTERDRIQQRTQYDLEMIREVGYCKGIENYSRHFSRRSPGDAPPCLLDYFPKDFVVFLDESHVTVPQLHAMCNGDRARKQALVEFGFRLPSAFDNRPLRFEEAYSRMPQVVFVSATPSAFEVKEAQGKVVEQIIRPTGLLDPVIDVRPAAGQVDDVIEEVRSTVERGGKVLITTLTKKLAEDLTQYLQEIGVKAKYLHADIDTLERIQIIHALRRGEFDVLVGINLLREGLDIPEVQLVAILDADKEGFLRSETSLVQTCGRAARNAQGRVVMYADKRTPAIEATLAITSRRRAIQQEYNHEHGITPTTVVRPLLGDWHLEKPIDELTAQQAPQAEGWTRATLDQKVKELEKQMRRAAKEFRFEEAARLRDEWRALREIELA
jgi:excinuclease ABC subunit B